MQTGFSTTRVLALRRGFTAVRRFSAHQAKGSGSNKGKSPPEPSPETVKDWSPRSTASDVDGGHEGTENPPPGYRSPVGEMYERPVPESDETTDEAGYRRLSEKQEAVYQSPVTGTRARIAQENEARGGEQTGKTTAWEGENGAHKISPPIGFGGHLVPKKVETRWGVGESTIVYHPAEEEFVNVAEIKPPGEVPDDEDQIMAEQEMHRWRRIT
jgi:hypothetical protein